MRDMGSSCFGEYAIQVFDASCSSQSSCISPNTIPSVQNEVTSVYRVILSTQKHLTITATWTRTSSNIIPPQSQGLSLTFANEDSNTSFKFNTISRLFKKKKTGNRSFQFHQSEINVFWDFSSAKYDSNLAGPEPINGFYVLVIVDSELGLSLGDMAEEAVSASRKVKNRGARCWLVSRRECFSGKSVRVSKAQFSENGSVHEVWIRFGMEKDGSRSPTLLVSIDRKNTIRVKRLQLNFRGNQTLFVDGLLVDLMWDVHGWFFDPENGGGVFMFRTRSGLDSRLWMEEEEEEKVVMDNEEKDKMQFSLVIYVAAGNANTTH